jgi:uncharacterized protein YegJ (DUF2314 family)
MINCRSFLVLALIWSVPQLGCTSISKQLNNGDDVVFVHQDNNEMKRAMERARVTLDEFLQTTRSNSEVSDIAVKIGISEGDNKEYFWITNFSETAGQFTGEISNEPRIVFSVQNGKSMIFGNQRS